MVLPGENPQELQQPENAWKLMAPWGLTPENAELERSAVYRFQARWAKTWNKGRCLIGGDAAHLMPPFAGEGMCAGLRDAVAMAWRLNGILEGRLPTDVLDSYTSERLAHARHYIDFSQELGQIICIDNETEAAARDAQMIADLAARDNAPVPTDICQLGRGIWDEDSAHAGELSVQGIVESHGNRDRFDQVVGQGWMLLGYDEDPADLLDEGQRRQLAALEGQTVRLVRSGGPADVVDTDGTFADWLGEIDAKYVLIRPDFYVALTARSPVDLRARFDRIMERLQVVAPVAAQ